MHAEPPPLVAREEPNGDANRTTGAEGVHWDLDALYPGPEALERDLEQTQNRADGFEQRYRGRVSRLDNRELAQAVQEFEALQVGLGRSASYAYLRWCTDTQDPPRGALLQKTREASAQLVRKILFFELEWLQLDEARAAELLSSQELQPFRHYLEVERRRAPHVLSEPEEKILAEKRVTGRAAWNRLFDQMHGAARYAYRDGNLTREELLSRLYHSDREVRRESALAFSRGLEERVSEMAFISNTMLADKACDDRLRKYPHWLASRNLDNEIGDDAVQVLVQAVTGRYDLVARHYRLKQRLLKLDVSWDYDRYAPVGLAPARYSWGTARRTVLGAYGAFHPTMESIAARFFDGRWIDAPPSPGKSGGAFSHQTVPPAHPYIMMNYTGNIRDVQTLAHELGHGVHQYLSRTQGYLQSRPPLTTSETASVFGEMLVFDHLLGNEPEPGVRLSILVSNIDDTMATVFRQIALHSFEERTHNARRSEGELSVDRFNELWIETQGEMFQGSVRLGEHYGTWWSYIPHFIHTPGYVYAYAFGKLLVLALYGRYKQDADGFAEEYLSLLEAGGSDWPHVQFQRMGVDLTDPNFWSTGLSMTEDMIRQAEELSETT